MKPVDRDVWEGVGQLSGEPVVLAKPRTFMNLSGKAGRSVLARHGGELLHMVVVHDDADLPLGAVRVKRGGGHGGHNGLRSLIQVLGDPGFMRIRLGVGRPEAPEGGLAEWILTDFRSEEQEIVEGLMERGADAAEVLVVQGGAAAMNRFNVPEGRR